MSYKSKVNAVTNVIMYKQRIGSKMIAGGLLSDGDSCKGCCTHCDICISCNCKLCNYHHCKWFSPLCYQNHYSSFHADKKLSVLINGHMSWVLWCFSFLPHSWIHFIWTHNILRVKLCRPLHIVQLLVNNLNMKWAAPIRLQYQGGIGHLHIMTFCWSK